MGLFSALVYKNYNYNKANTTSLSFRFVVMGDSRKARTGVNISTLSELLQKNKELFTQPSFILFTGDLVQGGSRVDNQLKKWKDVVDDYYPISSYYPALGNHDNDEEVFSSTFDYLPNEQLSGYGRTSYHFDYANARFIVLNSNRTNDDEEYVIDATQRAWLENLLKDNNKTHNFVMFHCPAYPVGDHVGSSLDSNPGERDALWSILDKYNVTAVFVGHECNYNRRLIDNSFNDNYDQQIYQLTLGGAGAPLNSTAKNTENVVVGPKAVYHYMIVDISSGSATFNVYDINNKQVDSFTVDRSNRN